MTRLPSSYRVSTGGGHRHVLAHSAEEAVSKATGCPPSHFTRTGPGEFTYTKGQPGHRPAYKVELQSI